MESNLNALLSWFFSQKSMGTSKDTGFKKGAGFTQGAGSSKGKKRGKRLGKDTAPTQAKKKSM